MTRKRLLKNIIDAAGTLDVGETPEVGVAVQRVGEFSDALKRSAIESIAGSIIAGVLSGGQYGMISVAFPTRMGVLLTSSRLLFMYSTMDGIKMEPGIKFSFPRDSIRSSCMPKGFVRTKFDLLDTQGNVLMTLAFAAIDKRDGEALAIALGAK